MSERKMRRKVNKYKISKGNKFLGPIPSFSLLAPHAIKPSSLIKKQGVIESYRSNYHCSLRDDFVEVMVKKIKKYRLFIINTFGSFYSQEYINKWVEIAKQCKYTYFFAYIRHSCNYYDYPKVAKLNWISYNNNIDRSKYDCVVSKELSDLKLDHIVCPKYMSKNISCFQCRGCFDKVDVLIP